MARIKIKDLPKDQKISKEELKRVYGGAAYLIYGGTEGESQDKDHKNWGDLLSFSQSTLTK
ncbi:MAG: hypothetical protein JRG97_03310 [Deltaproteobacteria bacterium]|nr:hypothetical protein [Deltaproteobacteria bacterium]MBW2052001.1 hypothetical protein [Deltaproteobacteria bacterium]MBW2140086.1 hypothetical protein [Deltaproteobacteria bacterium]MBW2323756.1 hypothetical protein [Deltaproteobacteria bacterium]